MFTFFFMLMLLPAILVLISSKVAGLEKISWAFGCFFCSWAGFIVFLVVTSLRPDVRATRPTPRYSRIR